MSERKIAIVTGAASGIGRATVERFSRDPKYKIIAVDINPNVMNKFTNPDVIPVVADVADREVGQNLVKNTVLKEGRIDILVNGAGVMNTGREETYRDGEGKFTDDYHAMRRVNALAPLRLIKQAAIYMRKQGDGKIVNITSTKEHVPDPYHTHYADLKAKLTRVTLSMSRHFKKDGIGIVALQPGNTKTNIDRADWTHGTNDEEANDVQRMNEWWRGKFGNNPDNVAEKIYKIAEGEIKSERVLSGADAYLAFYLDKIPGWKKIFGFGYGFALLYTKIRSKSNSLTELG